MRKYKIAAIPGDGIGQEVIPAGLAVLDVLAHALALLGGHAAPHPPETGGSTATSSS